MYFSSNFRHLHQDGQYHQHTGQPVPGFDHSLPGHSQSLTKVIRAITILHKACRTWRAKKKPNPDFTWSKVKDSISSSIIKCFIRSTEVNIASNKMKHLVVQMLKGFITSPTEVSIPVLVSCSFVRWLSWQNASLILNSYLGHGWDILQVLSHIQAKFFIPGVRKMITDLKKSCPGCIKLNNKPFSAFEADIPDVLKTIQPPFTYCQADIFGPILAHQDGQQLKRWVLVVLCLSSHKVHLEILHKYSTQCISRGFRRTFALRGTPRIIWIDAGLNIMKAGKNLIETEMKVITAPWQETTTKLFNTGNQTCPLNIKFNNWTF